MRNLWIFVLATWASMKDNAIQGMSKGILQHQGEYPEECWNQDAALFLTAHNVKSYWSKVVELDSPFHITVKGFGLSGGGGVADFLQQFEEPIPADQVKSCSLYLFRSWHTENTMSTVDHSAWKPHYVSGPALPASATWWEGLWQWICRQCSGERYPGLIQCDDVCITWGTQPSCQHLVIMWCSGAARVKRSCFSKLGECHHFLGLCPASIVWRCVPAGP